MNDGWIEFGLLKDVAESRYTIDITNNLGETKKLSKNTYDGWEEVLNDAQLLLFTKEEVMVISHKTEWFGAVKAKPINQ